MPALLFFEAVCLQDGCCVWVQGWTVACGGGVYIWEQLPALLNLDTRWPWSRPLEVGCEVTAHLLRRQDGGDHLCGVW